MKKSSGSPKKKKRVRNAENKPKVLKEKKVQVEEGFMPEAEEKADEEVMEDFKKEKMVAEKFYNPYPFPVRIINDLGEEQLLAPHGGHGKIKDGGYDQSPLMLLPYDPEGRDRQKKHKELDFDIRRVPEKECVKLAWAVCVEGNIKDLEKKTKKELVASINNVVRGWKR